MSDKRVVVPKGWGHEEIIANSPLYCGKRLVVKAGKKCSWHYHRLKDETFYVQSGLITLRYVSEAQLSVYVGATGKNEEELLAAGGWVDVAHLGPGDSFHVPVGMRHQFTGVYDSEMFEFSTEHKEEDSVRVIRGD